MNAVVPLIVFISVCLIGVFVAEGRSPGIVFAVGWLSGITAVVLKDIIAEVLQ